MKKYIINLISISIIIMTGAFVILGQFNWVEKRTFSAWAVELGVKVESIANNIYFCLIIGLLSIAMLLIGKHWSSVISTAFSAFNAIYSLKIPVYIWLGEEIFSKIDNSNTTYIATVAGYSALAISWVIVILQIILLVLTLSMKGGVNE